jgi:hypothetical protein
VSVAAIVVHLPHRGLVTVLAPSPFPHIIKHLAPVHGTVASPGVNPVIRGDPKPPSSVGPARAAVHPLSGAGPSTPSPDGATNARSLLLAPVVSMERRTDGTASRGSRAGGGTSTASHRCHGSVGTELAAPSSLGETRGWSSTTATSDSAARLALNAPPTVRRVTPTIRDVTPTGFGATPTGFGATPTGFGATPTGFGATPTGLAATPTGLAATRTCTAATLTTIAGAPDRIGRSPYYTH